MITFGVTKKAKRICVIQKICTKSYSLRSKYLFSSAFFFEGLHQKEFVLNGQYKLMSYIESIPEQDSLLQNSQMKLFLKRPSIQINLRPNFTSYNPHITLQKHRKTNLPEAGFTPSKKISVRSSSTSALSQERYSSRLQCNSRHTYDPRGVRKVSIPSVAYQLKMVDRINQQKNENIRAAFNKIDFKNLLKKKLDQKLALGIVSRQSIITLRPKVEVEYMRKINNKYQRNCPFEPDYLQSDYLP